MTKRIVCWLLIVLALGLLPGCRSGSCVIPSIPPGWTNWIPPWTTSPGTNAPVDPPVTPPATNPPPVTPPVVGDVLGDGRLSTIALDWDGYPHIAADGGSKCYFYDRVPEGWLSATWDAATIGSHQYYNPRMAIDRRGVMYVSGILMGNTVGLGALVRTNWAGGLSQIGVTVVNIRQNSWDAGNLAIDLDKSGEVIFSSAEGQWKSYAYDESVAGKLRYTGVGQFWAGHGGEKNVFAISLGGSVWHGAVGGWDEWSSSYRNSNMKEPVTWAAFSAYPSQASDMTYASVSPDSARTDAAYVASDLGGIYVNIWDGTKVVFPVTQLLCIDPKGTSGLRRFAPQMTAVPGGGVWIAWQRDGRVKLKYIRLDGSTGPENDVCPGGLASLVCDSAGDVHLAYNEGGQIKYLFLPASSLKGPVVVPPVVPPVTNAPPNGEYVHLWADSPVNVTASKGPEISGHTFAGADIRFLANDSNHSGYFLSAPRDAWSLSLDAAGNIVVSAKDFAADGARFRYVGFRAGSSGNAMRTKNPTTVPRGEWTSGDKTTGRFYWQTVEGAVTPAVKTTNVPPIYAENGKLMCNGEDIMKYGAVTADNPYPPPGMRTPTKGCVGGSVYLPSVDSANRYAIRGYIAAHEHWNTVGSGAGTVQVKDGGGTPTTWWVQ